MQKIIGFCSRHLLILIALFIIINGQYLDEPCRARRMRGICTYIEDCPFAQEQLQKRIHPQICGFDHYDPIVCCPKGNQNGGGKPTPKPTPKPMEQQPGRKSIEYCTLLKKKGQEPSVLTLTPAVVGGVNASPSEFPHMAALGFGDADDKQWLCGGTLISESFVLTAAHCLFSAQYGDVAYVRVGDLNLKSITDDAQPQDYNVVGIYRHPDYKPPLQYNDIGLVRLDQPAFFNKYVTPACLQTKYDLSGTIPIATGWGKLGFSDDTSEQLMKVSLVYYNNQQCRQTFPDKRRLPDGVTENTQICAGGGKDESKDTCQGDSGGPLQIKTSNFPQQYHVVGITSFGKACGTKNTPAVYTRVSNYIPWIESIVWPDND